MAERVIHNEAPQKAKVIPVTSPVRPKQVAHDEAPSLIVDHKYAPMGEWYTRCRYCRLAEAAHAQSEIQYYGDDAS